MRSQSNVCVSDRLAEKSAAQEVTISFIDL